ncbi:MAG TPA: hypothetical protein VJ867_07365 [Gemmatimonadaceae bacterium]|nr:hypothetical protein [Gemmatimonadaceae bacterium]
MTPRIAVVLAALTASCSVWRPQTATVADVLAAKHERMLRVNGNTLLFDPAVSGDSLVGVVSPGREQLEARHVAPDKRVSFALADVHLVEVRRISRGRTTALVAAAVVATLVVAFIASDPFGDMFGPGTGPILTLTAPGPARP